MRSSRLLFGLLACAAALATTSRAPATAATPSYGVLLGAAAYDPSGANITTLESEIGRTMAVDRAYSQWNDPQPSTAVLADGAAGRLSLISIRPQLSDGIKISWAQIAAGTQDAEIRRQATGLASLGHPVLLAFHHEADVATGYGAAADFRAAFRHYVSVVRATGEHNIAFLLILTAPSYGNAIAAWYPGDDVVDWAGADAYNFGICRPGEPAWRSFASATAAFRAWGLHHDKPLVLAEWASAEDNSAPGRKAQWISDAASVMRSWPQLRAASYFDEVGSCDWRLTTSASALNAFGTLARSVWANAGTTARLIPTSLGGNNIRWDGSASTGSHHITGHGIVGWIFVPGDGTPALSGTGRPGRLLHHYPPGDPYTAALTVWDSQGTSATTHTTIPSP